MIDYNTEALPLSEYGRFIRVEPYPRPRPAADEAECGALCDELWRFFLRNAIWWRLSIFPIPKSVKLSANI